MSWSNGKLDLFVHDVVMNGKREELAHLINEGSFRLTIGDVLDLAREVQAFRLWARDVKQIADDAPDMP